MPDDDENNGPDVATEGTARRPDDELPGVAIPGYPDWRAGAFAHGGGLLGMWKVSPPSADCGDLPEGYRIDSAGRLQLTPEYARAHPKGAFDFGAMAHNIDWPGVALDLSSIAASAIPLAGGPAKDMIYAMPGMGFEAWRQSRQTERKKD